jgi:hypothetical protein
VVRILAKIRESRSGRIAQYWSGHCTSGGAMRRTIATMTGVLMMAACGGGPSPQAACEQMVRAMCERSLECMTSAELESAGIPADLETCVRDARLEAGCDGVTLANACPPGTEYQAEMAEECIDGVGALTCSGFRDDGLPAACSQTCASGGGGGGDGIVIPDAGPGGGQACSMDNQAACGPGNKCGFVLENTSTGHGTFQCVPDGGRGEGAECYLPSSFGDYDSCTRGLVCWDGACQEYCDDQSDCGAGERCAAFSAADPYSACAETCDLLAQNCPATKGCFPWSQSDAICVTAGNNFASCTYDDDCSRGELCIPDDIGRSCAPICDYSRYPNQQAPQCSYDQVCVSLANNGPVYSGVGVCY